MPSDEEIARAIPAKFVMISGSEDAQTSADVGDVGTFQLPDPQGRAGGACTSTLLKVLHDQRGAPLSWVELLQKMRIVLRQKGFDQIPQLSASRRLDASHRFEIVPEGGRHGVRRAILIGINYTGQRGQLSGCHNDAQNIKNYLIKEQGFLEKDMLILMDDGRHHSPTKRNILDAFTRITQYSKAGDNVFIHYSGHGGHVRDTSGDEKDGYDETLIPVDFQSAGHILDDDIYKILVKAMPAGVTVTVLMDCCHSGTAMDLPFEMNATETKMHANNNFNVGALLNDPVALACCACLAFMFADDIIGGLFG